VKLAENKKATIKNDGGLKRFMKIDFNYF